MLAHTTHSCFSNVTQPVRHPLTVYQQPFWYIHYWYEFYSLCFLSTPLQLCGAAATQMLHIAATQMLHIHGGITHGP